MGTLRADLEQLETLSGTLHNLRDEAGRLKTGPAAGPYASNPGGVMPSVLEAASISADLIDAALVPAVKERLGETGDVLHHVAQQYRNQDESTAGSLVETYTDATGEWNAQEEPA